MQGSMTRDLIVIKLKNALSNNYRYFMTSLVELQVFHLRFSLEVQFLFLKLVVVSYVRLPRVSDSFNSFILLYAHT